MFQTNSHAMRKFLPLIIAIVAAWFLLPRNDGLPQVEPADVAVPETRTGDQAFIAGEQVTGVGTVDRLLPDENEGSRHQRFILRLDSGRTLLVAHNIDLAPRISELQPGDRIEFNGEFEPNALGGVIHWTHHDPQGAHEDGWLKHRGRVYQ